MKLKVPPTQCEYFISSGLFSENDDVTKSQRKSLIYFGTYSIGHKQAKKKGKTPNGDY